MTLTAEVHGRVVIVKDDAGATVAAGSPREVAEALKMRLKMLLNGK